MCSQPCQVKEYCGVEELPLWSVLDSHGEDSLKGKEQDSDGQVPVVRVILQGYHSTYTSAQYYIVHCPNIPVGFMLHFVPLKFQAFAMILDIHMNTLFIIIKILCIPIHCQQTMQTKYYPDREYIFKKSSCFEYTLSKLPSLHPLTPYCTSAKFRDIFGQYDDFLCLQQQIKRHV